MHISGPLRAATVVVVVGAAGCATEREPINQVQPNALEKSFFVGEDLQGSEDDPEFYSASTVIDVPYGARHGLFSGLAGGLARVKWEISEDALIARKTYEHINDTDGRGARTSNNGIVVAAFPIESHFDIRRDYNPSTGEELNVIEENDRDAPWYEREFMRVDWSQNLITSSLSWDPLAYDNMVGANYDVEPLAYYVEDPNHPDAPVFDGDAGYFDITQRLFVTPATINVLGHEYPTCFWNGAWVAGGDYQTGVCEPTELTLRMSFRRVPQPGDAGYTDYLPRHYDGARMDAFGGFYVERKGYDAQYGVVDDRWYRYLQRFDIWEESTTDVSCATRDTFAAGLDPNRDEDGNGTDDDCEEAEPGSQCNVFRQRCTVPYALRVPKPVAWHQHLESDDELLFQSTKRAVEEWDTATRLAVQAARYVECVRTRTRSVEGLRAVGGAYLESSEQRGNLNLVRASCRTAYPIAGHGEDTGQVDGVELAHAREVLRCWERNGRDADECAPEDPNSVAAMRPLAVLCHNPVRGPRYATNGRLVDAGDDPACGEEGLATRVGDLRYHSVNIWSTPEGSSPWGFGPSWADPLTGEVIQGSVNVYGAVTDLAARSVLDRSLWYAGELSAEEVTSGEYVRDWVAATSGGEPARAPLLEPDEVEARLLGMHHATVDSFAGVDSLNLSLDLYDWARGLQADLEAERAVPQLAGSNRAEFDQRIELAKGSEVEAALVGPMWTQAAGIDSTVALSGTMLELASPLRLQNAERLMNAQDEVQRMLADRGFCLRDAPEPSAVPALGKLLRRKFPPLANDASAGEEAERQQRMYDYLRSRLHYGLILHEMGHTYGLRHNFAGSADKFNYRPQYWQLRTEGGTVNEVCTEPVQDGSQCVGPRYFDPETQDEIDQSIHTWASTSVMDYAGEYTQDWMGLGPYDLAAARMFYADVVDVASDPGLRLREGFAPPARAVEMLGLVDRTGGIVGQWVYGGDHFLHYSEWEDFFGLLHNCREHEPEVPTDWSDEVSGIFDPVFDGQVVRGEVCERMPVDYVAWRDMLPEVLSEDLWVDPKFFTPGRPMDTTGRIRVPYMFEGDEFADGWSPSTLRRDSGADPYEQFSFFINRYENEHIFENYRRNRVGFSVVDAYHRAMLRTHYKLSYLTQGLSIMHDFWFRSLAESGTEFDDPLTGEVRRMSHADIIAYYEGEGRPMREYAIAASMAFDHFMRVLTRPNVGPHFSGVTGYDDYLVSGEDLLGFSFDPASMTGVIIPNGSSVVGTDVSFGGRPLTNGLQYGRGYHYYDYIDQAGSFYEKTFAFQAMLNAVYRAPASFLRFDALDGRWRHTNFTNLFPEGMRRALGLMLTDDYTAYAPRVPAESPGVPLVEEDTAFTPGPLGWVSFVKADGPEICWPSQGRYVCSAPTGDDVADRVPRESVPVEPQLGFEIQKFIAFWAYVYLPGSQVWDWVDMMRIYRTGADVEPGYLPTERVAWRDPETSLTYFARSYGDEEIFGRTYDRGVAAKMIQWAQRLTELAYELDETSPYDPDTGQPNPALDADAQPIVRADDSIVPNDPARLTCDDNRACQQLRRYRGLLDFMRDTAAQLGFPEPGLNTVD